jgi:Bacteriophage tail sheath protein
MPSSPTYPGVYVQEVPSGVRTITGVSTSIGMFIGPAKQGPMFKPVRCANYSAFRNTFGEDTSEGLLPHYVRLFFLNGGTDCYVLRLADGASASEVTLKDETGTGDVLRLEAKDLGTNGENLRAVVTYNGPQPEATFNLELFRWQVDATGQRTQQDGETWRNLSMDPNSPGYAPTFISQNSKLVNAVDLNTLPPPADTLHGFSLSGRVVSNSGTIATDWAPLLGSTASTNRFKISVRGGRYIDVDLHTIVVGPTLLADIATAIQTAFANQGMPGVAVDVTFEATSSGNRLKFGLPGGSANGGVLVRTGTAQGGRQDLAVPLMLGTENGGLEVSAFAGRRPAPNGLTFRPTPASLTALGDLTQGGVTQLTLERVLAAGTTAPTNIDLQPASPQPSVVTVNSGAPFSQDGYPNSNTGHSDGIREKLAIIAKLVNTFTPPAGDTWPWRAEVWGYRLALLPNRTAGDNFLSSAFALATVPALPPGAFTDNVRLYTLGIGGQNLGDQHLGVLGSDGTLPQPADYAQAYALVDKQVDLFNLMVLTPAAAVPLQSLYADASVFCQQRRAFLLMDPPSTWTDAQTAASGVAGLRVGLVKDYSAIFFPRITLNDNGLKKNLGPAGAIAGLCARIDNTRGVWKAPAGTEADLRGIVGLEQQFSDGENGILNPRAVNTLRIFPSGIVNWGGRTMDGDDDFGSEYKYIPIRRLALYLEESLYRGLKWVVFEPNDEPLWAQIRLNVGAFLHDLFRQGAFQGATPKDAYFVKCDSETTTQTDRNLGIVNIWVGFAPLKPAEFVILYLQQMAGQIQV